ncbi:hypothetical protein [Thermasporomyces composti]|jgi:hypothetical protein|uniref:Uncharacterized protein n=1 Tax=Thermasporomyces composti TaxID=696763 RepID=A0A3D9V127_THECX|nr:hypothetical protein [Thermasporomyces composti]REF35116.1 hypothetical protein DFJ64_0487 [Thermasporomyces composti]
MSELTGPAGPARTAMSPSSDPVSRQGTGTNRRGFLAGLATVAGALAVPVDLLRPRRASAATYDYTARETFDPFDRVFHSSGAAGQPDQPNDHGGLAWGQSYVLMGFMRMYDAYRDTYYLDRLIHNVDLVLANRDSVRGVTDYTGRSLPAWRAMHPYTVGTVRLTDGRGREVLEVRSARAYADETTVTVRSGSGDGRVTLEVVSPRYGVDTFPDVTMDPASSDYVVRRVYDAYPGPAMTTVRDLRADPADRTDPPRLGTFALSSQPVVFSVHTGMITYPIATFVRVVATTPTLRRNSRYKAKAEEYLAAVEAAVAVHDSEWREDDGAGYFRWPKGMPVPYDGTIQPINQSVALGRTYLELARVTRDPHYLRRAQALATMVRAQLVVDSGGAYIWPYWPTFSEVYQGYGKSGDPATDVSEYTPSYGSASGGAQQYEDLSHAAIEVDFAALAFRAGVVFKGLDMVRLARTFTQNLATSADGLATTYVRVDGGGGLAPPGQYLQAPRWMAVAPWDPALFTHALAIYVDHDVQPGSGSGVACVANLNWYARRFANQTPS